MTGRFLRRTRIAAVMIAIIWSIVGGAAASAQDASPPLPGTGLTYPPKQIDCVGLFLNCTSLATAAAAYCRTNCGLVDGVCVANCAVTFAKNAGDCVTGDAWCAGCASAITTALGPPIPYPLPTPPYVKGPPAGLYYYGGKSCDGR